MILKVFSVLDVKADAYMQPFFSQSRGVATRDFTDVVSNSDHVFSRHPNDFGLFELGEFDDSTGVITSHPVPVSLGLAREFLPSGDFHLLERTPDKIERLSKRS
nr:MAG: nonstructural protein [Microvirus sp.]